MTLEQLRIFVAVAEREHVTQAARDLNLTQSAVSAAVTALETRYNTRLFDRVGRRIALTPAGRLFLAEARAVLSSAAAAEAVLDDLSGLRRGTLALAASQTVANYWLPPYMQRYHALYPAIALSLEIGNTQTVAAMVRDGVVDIGVVEGQVDNPVLAVEPVAEDELVLFSGPAHLGADDGKVTPDRLRAMRWVFREHGSGTRAIFEGVLEQAGIDVRDLDIALELPSNEAVRTAVEAGGGAAVLSRLAIANALEAGAVRALDFALPPRRFYALRHRERHISHAVKAFNALISAADAVEGS